MISITSSTMVSPLLLIMIGLASVHPTVAICSPTQSSVYAKRGQGIWFWDADVVRTMQVFSPLSSPGSMSWWYNWATQPTWTWSLEYGRNHTPPIEFVPCVADLKGITKLDDAISSTNKYQKTRYILGYNEPQASTLSPLDGAFNWRFIENVANKYDLKVGSPAPGWDQTWADQFDRHCNAMYCIEKIYGGTGATCAAGTNCKICQNKPYGQRGCLMHFRTLHPYGCNATSVKRNIDMTVSKYNMSVWATEFGCAGSWSCQWSDTPCPSSIWNATTNRCQGTYDDMVVVTRQLLDVMDNHPNVSRYALWSQRASTDELRDNGCWRYQMLETGSDYDGKGKYWNYNLTAVGQLYNSYNLAGLTFRDLASM